MTGWAVAFLAIALVAAPFGFAGGAEATAGTARLVCAVFAGLGLLALLAGARRRPPLLRVRRDRDEGRDPPGPPQR